MHANLTKLRLATTALASGLMLMHEWRLACVAWSGVSLVAAVQVYLLAKEKQATDGVIRQTLKDVRNIRAELGP